MTKLDEEIKDMEQRSSTLIHGYDAVPLYLSGFRAGAFWLLEEARKIRDGFPGMDTEYGAFVEDLEERCIEPEKK